MKPERNIEIINEDIDDLYHKVASDEEGYLQQVENSNKNSFINYKNNNIQD